MFFSREWGLGHLSGPGEKPPGPSEPGSSGSGRTGGTGTARALDGAARAHFEASARLRQREQRLHAKQRWRGGACGIRSGLEIPVISDIGMAW